jgi:hypothetical protein
MAKSFTDIDGSQWTLVFRVLEMEEWKNLRYQIMVQEYYGEMENGYETCCGSFHSMDVAGWLDCMQSWVCGFMAGKDLNVRYCGKTPKQPCSTGIFPCYCVKQHKCDHRLDANGFEIMVHGINGIQGP